MHDQPYQAAIEVCNQCAAACHPVVGLPAAMQGAMGAGTIAH